MKYFTLVILFVFSWSLKCATNFDHDHKDFTALLRVSTGLQDNQTWVNYTSIKKSHRPLLIKYLRSLERISEKDYRSFTPAQRLAFLINAYNAFTIEWIVQHWPVKSIKDTSSLFSNAWNQDVPGYKLFGKPFTLDYIEHERIREEFNEPRIHFAVNCASIGCPTLRRSAFTSGGLEQELAQAEEEFFKNPKKFSIKANKIYVNPILKWYGKDFDKKFGTVEKYLRSSALKYGVSNNLLPQKLDIIFIDYDWSLNGN
jgi:hypothetical protein